MAFKLTAFCTSALVLLMASAPTHAAQRPKIDFDAYTRAIAMSAGHPNEMARWLGLWAYSNGRDQAAREYFERAASYADKPSQYLLSVMDMAGDGGRKDAVEACIWADLAAERGNNEKLLGNREVIWNSLTEEQRKNVVTLGPQFYARYGDAAAIPRTNVAIGRFSHSRTGSRAGGDTGRMNLSFGAGMPASDAKLGNIPEYAISQNVFYAPERVSPSLYWAQQDVGLGRILNGRVTTGDLKQVKPRL